jgi:rubrerythrin
MKVWRCKICGDSYVGTRRPSSCPFCGAHERFLLHASDWQGPAEEELKDTARGVLERALEIELNKSAFYACAADKAQEQLAYAVFDVASRLHGRHASVMRRMLGLSRRSTPGTGTCHETTEANLAEAGERQKKAVHFYEGAREELDESSVKEVCQALAEIETDQLTLVERLLRDLQK